MTGILVEPLGAKTSNDSCYLLQSFHRSPKQEVFVDELTDGCHIFLEVKREKPFE